MEFICLKTRYFKNSIILYISIFLLTWILAYLFLQLSIHIYENSHFGTWEATLKTQDIQNQIQKKSYYINKEYILESLSIKIPISNNTNLLMNIEIRYDIDLVKKSFAEIIYQVKDIKLENMEIIKNNDYFQVCNSLQVCREKEEEIREKLIENIKTKATLIVNSYIKIIVNQSNNIFLSFDKEGTLYNLKKR